MTLRSKQLNLYSKNGLKLKLTLNRLQNPIIITPLRYSTPTSPNIFPNLLPLTPNLSLTQETSSPILNQWAGRLITGQASTLLVLTSKVLSFQSLITFLQPRLSSTPHYFASLSTLSNLGRMEKEYFMRLILLSLMLRENGPFWCIMMESLARSKRRQRETIMFDLQMQSTFSLLHDKRLMMRSLFLSRLMVSQNLKPLLNKLLAMKLITLSQSLEFD